MKLALVLTLFAFSLFEPVLKRAKESATPPYLPIDERYVRHYTQLVVSYYDDGTIRSVSSPDDWHLVLTLVQGRPEGRADWTQHYQSFCYGQVEQFGPWDDGPPWQASWDCWVKAWIRAVAEGRYVTPGK